MIIISPQQASVADPPDARSVKRHRSPSAGRKATDPEPVLTLIRDVPAGQVASFGMIAAFLPGIGPRQVGRALSQVDIDGDVPWHRIVHASGTLPTCAFSHVHRERLSAEGAAFRPNGRIDWTRCRWHGPSAAWINASGWSPAELSAIRASLGLPFDQ